MPWWWSVVGAVIAVPTTEAVVVMGPEMSNQHPTRRWPSAVWSARLPSKPCSCCCSDARLSTSTWSGLRAEKVTLPASHIGRARALDAATAHRLLGPGLRADAHLSLRPWIKTAVQIEVDDSNDTTPYWVVATRRPSELVAALEFVRYAKAEL